jgi:hypothetical protein
MTSACEKCAILLRNSFLGKPYRCNACGTQKCLDCMQTVDLCLACYIPAHEMDKVVQKFSEPPPNKTVVLQVFQADHQAEVNMKNFARKMQSALKDLDSKVEAWSRVYLLGAIASDNLNALMREVEDACTKVDSELKDHFENQCRQASAAKNDVQNQLNAIQELTAKNATLLEKMADIPWAKDQAVLFTAKRSMEKFEKMFQDKIPKKRKAEDVVRKSTSAGI